MFHPAREEWKELVWHRAVEVQEQALRGLASA